MKSEKDLILRFMDHCHDIGPLGGVLFVFVFTVFCVTLAIVIIGGAMLLADALGDLVRSFGLIAGA